MTIITMVGKEIFKSVSVDSIYTIVPSELLEGIEYGRITVKAIYNNYTHVCNSPDYDTAQVHMEASKDLLDETTLAQIRTEHWVSYKYHVTEYPETYVLPISQFLSHTVAWFQ